MDKLILVRVNLYPKIGSGHFMRMIALADILIVKKYKINFICYTESEELARSLLNNRYSIEFVRNTSAVADANHIVKLAKKNNSKFIVLDGIDFTIEYDLILKKANLKTLQVVDFPNRQYLSDFVLNQNHCANEFHHLIGPNTILLTGLKYLLIRSEFIVAKKLKISKRNKRHLLICLSGGSSSTNKINKKLLEALILSENLIDSVTIVFGKMGYISERIKKLMLNTSFNIKIVKHLDDITKEMREASFAITSGGTTMWELMYIGVPFIAIPLNKKQMDYLKLLKRDNICEVINDVDQIDIPKIKLCLESFIKNKTLQDQFRERAQFLLSSSKKENQILNKLNL